MFEGSSNCSERSSGAAGIKYIVIILINELILIIKYLIRLYLGSNLLMGQNPKWERPKRKAPFRKAPRVWN